MSTLSKIPPCAPDLEEAVLGAMMLEQTAITTVMDILAPEKFYKQAHQMIYQAIMDLISINTAVDILTVTHRLRFVGNLDVVGGASYVSQLTNRVASTANIEVHARIICQKHISREIIRLANDTISMAYEDMTDVFDLLDLHNSTINKILHENATPDAQTASVIAQSATEDVLRRINTENYVSGVLTYIREFDNNFHGYQNSDLIYIAGRPSMGKTAYVISNMIQQAANGIPVAFFSLEMNSKQVMYRMLSQLSGIEGEMLSKVKLDETRLREYYKAEDTIKRYPLHIDDTAALNVFSFRAKVTRMVQKHGIKIVYVDYLQLMTAASKHAKYGNREQEIALISRTLKQVAKENNIPVVALSQLSRQSENRTSHKPILSDLRESGAIEQDADVVLFPYRPAYYGEQPEGNGNAEILVAKNRNGKLGSANMQFVEHLAKFTDAESKQWSNYTDQF